MSDPLPELVERVARLFHETYEELAPQFSYSTRKASAVPWEDVPENNKRLMLATVERVLAALAQISPTMTDGAVREDWPVGDPALNAAWDEIMADERLRIGGMPSFHHIRLIVGHTHRAMQAALREKD